VKLIHPLLSNVVFTALMNGTLSKIDWKLENSSGYTRTLLIFFQIILKKKVQLYADKLSIGRWMSACHTEVTSIGWKRTSRWRASIFYWRFIIEAKTYIRLSWILDYRVCSGYWRTRTARRKRPESMVIPHIDLSFLCSSPSSFSSSRVHHESACTLLCHD